MSTIGPIDASKTPRFAGPASFARLPRLDQVPKADVVVAGVPFDSGVSYRPGARFGPGHIRAASKLLRPYHPRLDVEPFAAQQVADAGDIAVNPFDIAEAVRQIEEGAVSLGEQADRLVVIAGGTVRAAGETRVLLQGHDDLEEYYFGLTSASVLPGAGTPAPTTVHDLTPGATR